MHPSTVTVEYSISDLCKEFDITTRTIRHYEDLDLLSPSRRGQSRVYTPSDRTRLRLILRGKRLGLSLEDSPQILIPFLLILYDRHPQIGARCYTQNMR